MEDDNLKNDLINRLLNSNISSNSSNNEATESENLLNNLTPEQIQLLSKLYNQQQQHETPSAGYKKFLPDPGFCLKTKNSNQEKVFLNICKSTEISEPKDISEQELLKLIEDPENAAFQFRVPMSLAEPHNELDNAGCSCTAYDICVHPTFLKKCLESSSFMGFLVSIVIEGLEEKYKIKLDRNCKMLQNKKFMGKIQEQHIRLKSKPLIAEVNETLVKPTNEPKVENAAPSSNKNNENKYQIPQYKIFREPADGPVEFLVAEVELPNIISSKSVTLDIGEDRIVLKTRSGIYFLDIFLPFNLAQEECGAQFDRKTKVLTITMPVQQ